MTRSSDPEHPDDCPCCIKPGEEDRVTRMTIYCSCGEALAGFMVETERAWETRVHRGADHVEAGHTIWVRGRPVTKEIIAMVNGQPTGKMSAPTYTDPR